MTSETSMVRLAAQKLYDQFEGHIGHEISAIVEAENEILVLTAKRKHFLKIPSTVDGVPVIVKYSGPIRPL